MKKIKPLEEFEMNGRVFTYSIQEYGSIMIKEVQGAKKTAPPSLDRFIPPELKEVEDYCKERKNNVDPEKFYNHYESNGWMVGKNKMKKWRAAIITWERSNPKPQGDGIKMVM